MMITATATATKFCAAWAAASPAAQVRRLTYAIEGQEFATSIAASRGRTEQELGHREATGVLRLRRLRVRQAAGLHP